MLHELLNVYRTSVGCTSLRWHEPAARVAEAHSRDMESRDYLDHVSPEGTDPGRRLLAGGVTWHGLVAENIERCDFTHHGIGRHADRWTQVLIQNPGPGP